MLSIPWCAKLYNICLVFTHTEICEITPEILLIQLLGGEAAEIVTIQPDSIKLQNTSAKQNTARPFVYCLYSHTFLLMASPNLASLITTESRQPQLTSHFAPEIPAGRAALPFLLG